HGAIERRDRILGRRVGDLAQRLAAGRVLNGKRLAAAGVAPLASDEDALRHLFDDRVLLFRCDCHLSLLARSPSFAGYPATAANSHLLARRWETERKTGAGH